MPAQPWVQGIVTKIIDETSSTKRFTIQIPSLSSFDFKPGQFVTIDLPIHEKPNKRWRSYSIASWPDGTNSFELVIVLLETGLGTPWIWANWKEGSEVTLRGPQGVFTLPETIDKDLYFICTGTGIAPFRSMAHHILHNNIPHKNLYLIFGCRKFGDSLYEQELKALQEQYPSFKYLPTFSREPASEDGSYLTGYVHKVYDELIRAGMKDGQLPEAQFYLCGWKSMLDDARKNIAELGYDKKAVHFELYG